TTLTGLGMGAAGIAYSGVSSLAVQLGSGGDTLTIVNTIPGTTMVDTGGGSDLVNLLADSGPTTVNTGDGADTVNVVSTAAPTVINAGAGNDTINVGSLAPQLGGTLRGIEAALTVDGGADTDALHVDDSGETVGQVGLQTGWLRATTLSGLSMGPA